LLRLYREEDLRLPFVIQSRRSAAKELKMRSSGWNRGFQRKLRILRSFAALRRLWMTKRRQTLCRAQAKFS